MNLLLLGSIVRAESLLFSEERSTAFVDVVASSDEQFVAFGTGSTGQVHLLNTDSWSFQVVDACTGTLGGLAFASDNTLYIGCSNSGAVQIEPSTGETLTEIAVNASEFYFANVYGTKLNLLAKNPNGGNPRMHQVDLSTGQEVATGNFPNTLGYGAAQDMEQVGSYLIVSHGSTSLSKVDPNTGNSSRDQQGPTTGTCTDILPSANGSNALVAAGTAGVYRFLYSSNQIQFAAMGADLDNVTALVAHKTQLWVADAGSDSLKAFSYNSGAATMGNEILSSVSLGENRSIQEMVSVQGYIVAGAEDGGVFIIGEGPWVTSSLAEEVSSEDSVTILVSSSESGSYQVLLNATSNDDGTLLGEGSIEAETETTLTFPITSEFIEGENAIRIVVTSDNVEGHDAVFVTVDTPPITPDFTDQNVGYGDSSIFLSGTAISSSDASYYQVYLSTEAFESTEASLEEPVLDGYDLEVFQISVEPSKEYTWTIEGLNNDQPYYIALRAFDEGGLYSEVTGVLSVTPRDTLSAAQLTSDNGGFCGLDTPLQLWTVLSVMGGIFMRRRKAFTPYDRRF